MLIKKPNIWWMFSQADEKETFKGLARILPASPKKREHEPLLSVQT